MKEFGLFINGRFEAAEGGKTMETVNPATEEPWAKVGKASRNDVRKAIAAAKKSFDSGVWRSKSKEERAKVLESVAAAIMERGEELAAAEAQDGGGTIRKASFMDVPARPAPSSSSPRCCARASRKRSTRKPSRSPARTSSALSRSACAPASRRGTSR